MYKEGDIFYLKEDGFFEYLSCSGACCIKVGDRYKVVNVGGVDKVVSWIWPLHVHQNGLGIYSIRNITSNCGHEILVDKNDIVNKFISLDDRRVENISKILNNV